MKKRILNLTALLFIFFVSSCSGGSGDRSYEGESMDMTATEDMVMEDSAEMTDEMEAEAEEAIEDDSEVGAQEEAGLITAGEWNDLANWDFWLNVLDSGTFTGYPEMWEMYTNNRVSVQVTDGNTPVENAKVELVQNTKTIWTARTDNFGYAELWVSPHEMNEQIQTSKLSLKVDGAPYGERVKLFGEGVNSVKSNALAGRSSRVELSFIVDATGSMGDELEFLKADLQSVIDGVQDYNDELDIYTSTVFYRDQGDDYVVKSSPFTGDFRNTKYFINHQGADGGGDFPEAVHTALDEGINELNWSEDARTRIAFLLLDAPPHTDPDVISSMHESVLSAAEQGIKIIPIVASGIGQETEYLMRSIAMFTNSTYVFITDDSGIGNDHLEATVGSFEVEYLNELMIRLIKKYSE